MRTAAHRRGYELTVPAVSGCSHFGLSGSETRTPFGSDLEVQARAAHRRRSSGGSGGDHAPVAERQRPNPRLARAGRPTIRG